MALILGGLDVAYRVTDVSGPSVPPAVVPLAVGALVGGIGLVFATLRYKSWRFELTDEWIHARWGVITRQTATIPRNRIQTLTSENGPIDRLLDLTSVTVHTAGSAAPNLAIPHLKDETVEWLRSELAVGSAHR
ncbi:MAG: PH domain-containing protein [Actinomycetota bacterium]